MDRDEILRTARRYIDVHGLARLTMRRLGAELGVEAMALYRYVPSREDLLDGIAEGLVDELLDDDRLVVRSPEWQAYLQELAHAVRDVALAHPQVFPIVATRPPTAPWLRPPLRSLRFVESFLSSLDACGFSEPAIVYTYRAFSTFLLGHLMLEVSALGADVEASADADGSGEPGELNQYPTVVRLAPALATNHGLQEFEESLESLLDRIHTSITTN
ncbi:MAG: TetR/AcrR family transcriptional regulator [Propionibacteriaceae bacterium]